MEDKEFIVEAVKRLLPDTSWYGETNHDNRSIANIEIVKEILQLVLENFLNDMFISKGYENNGSYQKISKAKQEALKDLIDYFEDEINESLAYLNHMEENRNVDSESR